MPNVLQTGAHGKCSRHACSLPGSLSHTHIHTLTLLLPLYLPLCLPAHQLTNRPTGPLPAALAGQPNLAYINLASNQLTGTLEGFAQALPTESMVGAVFDVSTNQLSGPIPNGLSNLAAFNSIPAVYPSWGS